MPLYTYSYIVQKFNKVCQKSQLDQHHTHQLASHCTFDHTALYQHCTVQLISNLMLASARKTTARHGRSKTRE